MIYKTLCVLFVFWLLGVPWYALAVGAVASLFLYLLW